MVSHEDGHLSVWSHEGGLSSVRVVCHQDGLIKVVSSGWSVIRVVSHQGGVLAFFSLARILGECSIINFPPAFFLFFF